MCVLNVFASQCQVVEIFYLKRFYTQLPLGYALVIHEFKGKHNPSVFQGLKKIVGILKNRHVIAPDKLLLNNKRKKLKEFY
jgi:hypothetical protein